MLLTLNQKRTGSVTHPHALSIRQGVFCFLRQVLLYNLVSSAPSCGSQRIGHSPATLDMSARNLPQSTHRHGVIFSFRVSNQVVSNSSLEIAIRSPLKRIRVNLTGFL